MRICLILLLLLAGCAVGPNYQSPKSAAAKQWAGTPAGKAYTNAVPVVEWWQTFQDARLSGLVARATEANGDLRIAEGRLREARALRSGAYWDLAPTITGRGSYIDARRSENAQTFAMPKLHTGTYDAHLDASWEIDLFGGKRRTVEYALAQYAVVEEGRRDVLLSVLAEVARNYIEVRAAQQRWAIAQTNLQIQAEVATMATARFRAGLTSELDPKQAEALLAATRAQLPLLETVVKRGIHRLSVLLGQPPTALQAELSVAAPIPGAPPVVPVGLPSDLLRRRPDVRRAERELAAATAGVGMQVAEYFPKFSLIGTGGFSSLSASDWIAPGSRYWSAGPTVTWRLLDFGRIRAMVKAADARQAQALAAYEQTVLRAFEDVENALVAYANEQVRYRSLQEAVAAQCRALELAQELYKQGLRNFLHVLEAQRSLYQTEDQRTDSERAVAANLVALYKALGGGWESKYELAEKR